MEAAPVEGIAARSNTPRFRSFFVVDLAVSAIEMARSFVDRLRRHDRELETQMRRALTRCGLALGEGQKRNGGNQQAAYRRARGEANEALTAVRLAAAWGYMEGSDALVDKLDHLVAVLVRLTR